MARPLLDRLELDDVLFKFKLFDRYHAVTITILTVALIFEFMWYSNHVLVLEKVDYRCVEFKSNHNSSNTTDRHNDLSDWCKNPGACSQWVYDNPDSFVAEFQLACQDWKRTSVGSAHILGYMLGLLIVGPLSDRFGRKTLILATCIIGGILGIAKSFVSTYSVYVALEFLEPLIGDSASPIFTLVVEMGATKSRVTYSNICHSGLGVGCILFPLIAWLTPYWRNLLRVVYAPGIIFISFIYLLDESPRWLLANGKKSAAVKIIRKAAKRNKMEIEENLNMITYEKENQSSFITAIRDTFKSKFLIKRFFVCSVWWASASLVNFGLVIISSSLKGNKYINFALMGLMKTLGTVIAASIINKFNRRGPLILSFVACAVLCTGQPFIPKSFIWLQIIVYMAGMLVSSLGFYIIYIFTSELFPTQSRNCMHALCSSVGRVGALIAPQTPLLLVYWSGLPTVVFGAASLIAGLVTLLVPDTADRNLPDTVCQAEKFETKVTTEGPGYSPHRK